eukprot:CCRYP_003873-RA/>CCRYP_003873-RA protein AED:0.08 eAED:0.08 QI:1873/1/0.87/1/0.85/0.75/8/36/800
MAEVVEEEVESPLVVLFPWFAVFLGVVVYYVLSRYAHGLPYTAVMFITGAMMGYSALHAAGNGIVDSTRLWLGINGEIIILAFLPGLLFLDSYNSNVYLFQRAFLQIITFAFPMVLAGTALTACVAYYIFPYGWSFDLSMTFGAILSATDPVAVAVLLNELGAPSRLKVHIAGESLMNDGSSVVFFRIFSSRFFYELGFHGFEQIGWFRGLALFFRLSLGGACIGLLFGIGLVTILFNLNRRLSKDENVLQVTATIMTAYLSFFVSEIMADCSGIIAVVFCGLTTKAFGISFINDSHLTEDFWHIMEHLLNSTLFTLGGAIWGGIINFGGREDWLYLLLLYASLYAIRTVLVVIFFPITSNIGIKQNWQEACFMAHAGLRGAVGIALALLLSAETHNAATIEQREQYQEYVDKLFGMVGGIAFLTLVINAPTSPALLNALGLVNPTEARKSVVRNYELHMRQNTLIEFMKLLSEETFKSVDFGVVREYVSPLAEVTTKELDAAVVIYRKRYPDSMPDLHNVMRYVGSETSTSSTVSTRSLAASFIKDQGTVYDFSAPLNEEAVLEKRQIFIHLLEREYHRQLLVGELDSRGGTPFSLLQSLQLANESATKGSSLQDWDASQSIGKWTRKLDKLLHTYRVGGIASGDEDFHAIRTQVLQALSFIKAHTYAQETFKAEFASVDGNSLTLSEKAVLDESREQVSRAEAVLNAFDAEDVNAIKSQYVCQILLYKCADYFRMLAHNGLMSEREVGEFLEKYDKELRQLRSSSELKCEISYLKMSNERCGIENRSERQSKDGARIA